MNVPGQGVSDVVCQLWCVFTGSRDRHGEGTGHLDSIDRGKEDVGFGLRTEHQVGRKDRRPGSRIGGVVSGGLRRQRRRNRIPSASRPDSGTSPGLADHQRRAAAVRRGGRPPLAQRRRNPCDEGRRNRPRLRTAPERELDRARQPSARPCGREGSAALHGPLRPVRSAAGPALEGHAGVPRLRPARGGGQRGRAPELRAREERDRGRLLRRPRGGDESGTARRGRHRGGSVERRTRARLAQPSARAGRWRPPGTCAATAPGWRGWPAQ